MKKTIVISAAVIAVALVAVFAVRWLLPARARPHASDGCMSHLSQLGKLFQMYAIDHAGRYPDSWQEAHDYLASWSDGNTAKLFVCRRSGQKPGPTNRVDSWCSFTLVPGLTTNTPKHRLHAYCDPEHHEGRGANALFTDGSVMWFKKEQFEDLVKAGGMERPQQAGSTVPTGARERAPAVP